MNITSDHRIDDAFATFQLSQIFVVIWTVLILPLEIWGMCEFFRDSTDPSAPHTENVRIKRIRFRMRMSLFANTVSCTLLACCTTLVATSTGLNSWQCDALVKFLVIVYLIMVLFAYIFMIQKVLLVASFDRSSDQWYKKVFYLSERGLALALPLCIILFGCLTFGELTTPTGRCMQRFPQWIIWVFAGTNVLLSLLMLYLFAYPIRKLANNSTSSVSGSLKRMYQKNTALSLLGVFLSFVTVASEALLHQFAWTLNRKDFYVYGMLIVGWETVLLSLCIRITTHMWLPKRLQWIIAPKRTNDVVEQEEESPRTPAGAPPVGSVVPPVNLFSSTGSFRT